MSASPYQCHCWNNLGGQLVYAKFKSYEGTTAFDEIDIFIDDDHHLNLPAASANTVKVEVYDPTDNGGGWYVLGCYQVNNEDRVKVDSINSTSGPPPPPGQVYVNNQIVTGITCPEPNPGERPADPPPRQRRSISSAWPRSDTASSKEIRMSDAQYQCHCWNNLGGDMVHAKFKSYAGGVAFDEIDIPITDDHHLNLPQATGNTVKVEVYDLNTAAWFTVGCYAVNSGDRVKVDNVGSINDPPPPVPWQVYVNNQTAPGTTCP